MPVNYQAPGIYVEEVSGGARPIQAVGTSTAGFVGVAPNAGARVNEPVAITNWSEFVRIFVTEGSTSTALAQAVYGFFLNGGSYCYVCNVGNGAVSDGLDALAAIDGIAIVAAPGMVGADVYDALLTHCESLQDRVCILDMP